MTCANMALGIQLIILLINNFTNVSTFANVDPIYLHLKHMHWSFVAYLLNASMFSTFASKIFLVAFPRQIQPQPLLNHVFLNSNNYAIK